MSLVDVVIPCYNESALAVRLTILAVKSQSMPPARVTLVDDCSDDDAVSELAPTLGVDLLRLPENAGIAAARNTGIRHGSSPFIACINVEVLPEPGYIETCSAYMDEHPNVGVVAVRTLPEDLRAIRTRWRMLYHEAHYPTNSGKVDWGSGHALFFRREAIERIGGFDERRGKAGEDLDACWRLQSAGWEVHFVANTGCVSIQEDSWRTLARAEYNRSVWRANAGNGILRGLTIATNRLAQRSVRHLVFLRWRMLPVELSVYWHVLPFIWRHR